MSQNEELKRKFTAFLKENAQNPKFEFDINVQLSKGTLNQSALNANTYTTRSLERLSAQALRETNEHKGLQPFDLCLCYINLLLQEGIGAEWISKVISDLFPPTKPQRH